MPIINHHSSQSSLFLMCNSLLKTWKMIINMIFIMIFTTIGIEGEMDYEMVEEFGDDFTIAINSARCLMMYFTFYDNEYIQEMSLTTALKHWIGTFAACLLLSIAPLLAQTENVSRFVFISVDRFATVQVQHGVMCCVATRGCSNVGVSGKKFE